jgi:diaminopimelate epimerase
MPEVRDATKTFDTSLEPGEQRIGYARVGVPHLVVQCENLEAVEVVRRGRELRHLRSLQHGANVNFVARRGAEWSYRTYERGVEEETLACGSGSVAVAAMLQAWHGVGSPVRMLTRSGAPLAVHFTAEGTELAGEGRLVFEGRLRAFTRP